MQPTGSQTTQHGAHGRERVAKRRLRRCVRVNSGSCVATFSLGWNGSIKSLVTCTYSGGHGRWSQWSLRRPVRMAAKPT